MHDLFAGAAGTIKVSDAPRVCNLTAGGEGYAGNGFGARVKLRFRSLFNKTGQGGKIDRIQPVWRGLAPGPATDPVPQKWTRIWLATGAD